MTLSRSAEFQRLHNYLGPTATQRYLQAVLDHGMHGVDGVFDEYTQFFLYSGGRTRRDNRIVIARDLAVTPRRHVDGWFGRQVSTPFNSRGRRTYTVLEATHEYILAGSQVALQYAGRIDGHHCIIVNPEAPIIIPRTDDIRLAGSAVSLERMLRETSQTGAMLARVRLKKR